MDVIHQDKKLYLVFEFLDVDLKKHFDTHPHISNDRRVIKGYLYQMCAGIAYCHCTASCIAISSLRTFWWTNARTRSNSPISVSRAPSASPCARTRTRL